MENGTNAGVLDMVPAAVLHRGGAVCQHKHAANKCPS